MDKPLLEPTDSPRDYLEKDWEGSVQAAQVGRHHTGLWAASKGLVSCSNSRLAGGVAKFKMAYDSGDGIYRSVKARDGLWLEPAPGVRTLADVWKRSAEKYANEKCMGWREIQSMTVNGNLEKYVLSPYEWITYKEAYDRSVSFGRGLLSLGSVKAGEHINLFAETKAEWQLAAQGCYQFGLVVSTTYANLGADAVAYGINETKSKIVLTDADLLPVVTKVLSQCPTVKHVIFIQDKRPASSEAHKSEEVLRKMITDASSSVQPHSFEEILQLGESNPIEPPVLDPSSMAMIMFTSGSTGLPKGVMISHANAVAAIAGASSAVPSMCPEDYYLAYLPLAHILEVTAEGSCYANGVAVGYGSPKTVTDNSVCVAKGSKGDATELRPTLMAAVPMIMDKIRAGVNAKVNEAGGLLKKMFDAAYHAKSKALAKGYDTPFWNKLVFDKLRSKLLGGRLRFMLSGGGPLSAETQEFMNIVFCCPVGQGYGLTESVGVSTTVWPNDRTANRVGAVVPSTLLKLVDWEEGGYYADPSTAPEGMRDMNPRGEVLLGGPQITMGYFNQEDKTKEAFFEDENGIRWLRTGDIGEIHPDGVLQIIDRKKDLVKLSHGEYISLGKLEPLVRDSNYVDNAMVYADSNKSYCVVLVTRPPNSEPVDSKVILEDITRILKKEGCAKFEIPKKIHVCDEEWGPHNDLCTAALKLKRQNLLKHYKSVLEELYKD